MSQPATSDLDPAPSGTAGYVHLFALAMRHNIPASSLKEDLFAFPTFSSDVKNLF